MKRIIFVLLIMVLVVSTLPLGTILAGVRPSVSVSKPSASTVQNGSSVSYTVTFSNANSINLTGSYITLNGFTANVNVSGTGNVKTVTLSNVQGTAGNKNITIKEGAASNENGQSLATPKSISFALVETATSTTTTVPTVVTTPVSTTSVDSVRPSISVSSPSVKSVNAGGSVSYTVTFTDNVGVSKVNLSESYITLNGFTANVNISGTGNVRTVTLSNVQGTAGNKNIAIKAGAAEDAASNSTLATPNSISFALNQTSTSKSVDSVRPSVSISEPSAKKIYVGETVSYVISFADNNGIAKVNLTKDYIVLNGFTADVKITGTGDTRTVTLSNVKGEVGKNCNITIKANAAEDAAGNGTIQTPHSISFQLVNKTVQNQAKLDSEPNTGVRGLPVLIIMTGSAIVLGVAGYIITKKIYG